METKKGAKKLRADGQISGLAGEFFVAAELLKRGHQTSVTFGNAKAIDLLAYNSKIERSFPVQVKTVRKRNFWPIYYPDVKAGHVYVFVVLNGPGEAVDYFVVPGAVLKAEPQRFGNWHTVPREKVPGIHPNKLEGTEFENNWASFDEAA